MQISFVAPSDVTARSGAKDGGAKMGGLVVGALEGAVLLPAGLIVIGRSAG